MLKEKVSQALEGIRGYLQADGGDIQLVEVTDDGVVKVAFQGACAGCPMSSYTLKLAVEKKLKELVPEVKTVEQV